MSTESTSNSTTELEEEYPVAEHPARFPTHPGSLLREVLEEGLGLSVSEAARQLGVSRMTLHRIKASWQ